MLVRWPRPLFYALIVLVVVVDQLTKLWATASLRPVHSVTLIPGFFDLTYVENRGIAFGLFQGDGLLIGVFVIVLALVAVYYTRGLDWAAREPNLVGGCICGGAMGNLLDRARLGHVVDFFGVHVGPHFWPFFNVADSVICCAVGWVVVRQFAGPAAKSSLL
jgi:signal peptidase II